MTTAIILAGGQGTRLGGNVPKAMLEINGKPLIQRQLEYLASVNISDVVLCVGYLADKVSINSLGAVNTYLSIEKEPLGTAGAIKLAYNTYPDLFKESVYVLNVDDLARLSKEELTFLLGQSAEDETQFIIAKPIAFSIWAGKKMYAQNETFQHIGHTVLTTSAIDYLPVKGSLETHLAEWSNDGIVKTHKYDGEWFTCNTYDQHRLVDEKITATEMLLAIKAGKRTGI